MFLQWAVVTSGMAARSVGALAAAWVTLADDLGRVLFAGAKPQSLAALGQASSASSALREALAVVEQGWKDYLDPVWQVLVGSGRTTMNAELISGDALQLQVVDRLAQPTNARPLTIVVSPAPVFDHPLVFLGIRTRIAVSENRVAAEEWENEPWGGSPRALHRLLGALAELESVVILSGDVHYACSSVNDYSAPGAADARFVQLTSSSVKNSWEPSTALARWDKVGVWDLNDLVYVSGNIFDKFPTLEAWGEWWSDDILPTREEAWEGLQDLAASAAQEIEEMGDKVGELAQPPDLAGAIKTLRRRAWDTADWLALKYHHAREWPLSLHFWEQAYTYPLVSQELMLLLRELGIDPAQLPRSRQTMLQDLRGMARVSDSPGLDAAIEKQRKAMRVDLLTSEARTVGRPNIGLVRFDTVPGVGDVVIHDLYSFPLDQLEELHGFGPPPPRLVLPGRLDHHAARRRAHVRRSDRRRRLDVRSEQRRRRRACRPRAGRVRASAPAGGRGSRPAVRARPAPPRDGLALRGVPEQAEAVGDGWQGVLEAVEVLAGLGEPGDAIAFAEHLATLAEAVAGVQELGAALDDLLHAVAGADAGELVEELGADFVNLLVIDWLGRRHPVLQELLRAIGIIRPVELAQLRIGSDGPVMRRAQIADRLQPEMVPALLADPTGELRAFYGLVPLGGHRDGRGRVAARRRPGSTTGRQAGGLHGDRCPRRAGPRRRTDGGRDVAISVPVPSSPGTVRERRPDRPPAAPALVRRPRRVGSARAGDRARAPGLGADRLLARRPLARDRRDAAPGRAVRRERRRRHRRRPGHDLRRGAAEGRPPPRRRRQPPGSTSPGPRCACRSTRTRRPTTGSRWSRAARGSRSRAGEGDSFLRALLGGIDFDVEFDLGLGWSRERGLTLSGTAALENRIALDLSFGPLSLTWLDLLLALDGDIVRLVAGVGARAPVRPLRRDDRGPRRAGRAGVRRGDAEPRRLRSRARSSARRRGSSWSSSRRW